MHRSDYSASSILFVGPATVILRYAGFTILTDPNILHAGRGSSQPRLVENEQIYLSRGSKGHRHGHARRPQSAQLLPGAGSRARHGLQLDRFGRGSERVETRKYPLVSSPVRTINGGTEGLNEP